MPKMRFAVSLLTPSASLALLLLGVGPLAAAPLTLEEILKKLDANASQFRSMTAKIERLDYTSVLKDTTKESGEMILLRKKPGVVEMRMDIKQPDAKQIGYADKRAQIYLPKIKTLQIYDVGKYDSLISQGILIGFGNTSKELKKNYDLKAGAEEMIDGKPATKLELTPKGTSPLLSLKRIEVWIGHADGYPLRHKMVEASGDFKQATYMGLKINPNLPDSAVRLDVPKDAKKEYPGR